MSSERSPDVRFVFDHDDSAPKRARAAIDPLVSEPDDPIADDVHLAVSELVTNVVRHTADGGVLEAWDPKPNVPLRVEVSDTDTTAVQPMSAADRSPTQVGGLGLHIVDATSDDWGVEPTTDGKKVWAVFDRNKRHASND